MGITVIDSATHMHNHVHQLTTTACKSAVPSEVMKGFLQWENLQAEFQGWHSKL